MENDLVPVTIYELSWNHRRRRKEIHEKCLLIGSLAEMEIFRETPVVFVRRRDNGAIRIPRRCVSGIHFSLPLSLRNRTITRKMQYDAREEERKGEEEKKRHGTGTKEKNNTLFSYS